MLKSIKFYSQLQNKHKKRDKFASIANSLHRREVMRCFSRLKNSHVKLKSEKCAEISLGVSSYSVLRNFYPSHRWGKTRMLPG